MRHWTKALHILLLSWTLAAANTAAPADVVVVVSPQNPISSLSRFQIADIFLGRASRFPNGTPVDPIDQAPASMAHEEFYQQIVGKSPSQIKAYWSKLIFTGRGRPPPNIVNIQRLKQLVSDNPSAISYLEREAVDSSVKIVEID